MTKNDQELLAEAYQDIQEGWLRRLGSRIGGAAGKVTGTARRLGAAVTGNEEAFKKGKDIGKSGKQLEFKKSIWMEIEKDARVLGVVRNMEAFGKDIKAVLDKHIPTGTSSYHDDE